MTFISNNVAKLFDEYNVINGPDNTAIATRHTELLLCGSDITNFEASNIFAQTLTR